MPTSTTKKTESKRSSAIAQHPQWVLDAVAELPAVLTKDEVAALLRVSTRTICRYAAVGQLTGFHLANGGGANRLMITRASVADLLAQSSAR